MGVETSDQHPFGRRIGAIQNRLPTIRIPECTAGWSQAA